MSNLLLIALLLNPLAILLLVTTFISFYLIILCCVSVFSVLTTLRDFVIAEWHPYLDPETIRKLEEFRFAYKVKTWISLVFLEKSGDKNDAEVLDPPALLQRYPVLTQLILAGPLSVYMLTRLVTYLTLMGIQWMLVQAYYLGPEIVTFIRAGFRLLLQQARWMREVVLLIFYPFRRIAWPVLQRGIRVMLRLATECFTWFFERIPPTAIFIYNKTEKLRAVLYSLAKRLYWEMLRLNEEYVLPTLEKTRQIALRIWPYVRKFLLTVVATCEAVDNRIRPYIKSWYVFFSRHAKWFILLGLGIARIILHTIWEIAYTPFWVTGLVLSWMKAQFDPYLQMVAKIVWNWSIQFSEKAKELGSQLQANLLILFEEFKVQARALIILLSPHLQAAKRQLIETLYAAQVLLIAYIRILQAQAIVVLDYISKRAS